MGIRSTAPILSFHGPYRFLSNFYRSPIEIDGHTYLTAEHAYQALKTKDEHEREMIRRAPTPGKAKQWGKEVTLRHGWEGGLREVMMERVVKAKYDQHPELERLLLETGDRELIEGNSWGDTFWGKCNGRGENKLGKIHMKERVERRNKENKRHGQ